MVKESLRFWKVPSKSRQRETITSDLVEILLNLIICFVMHVEVLKPHCLQSSRRHCDERNPVTFCYLVRGLIAHRKKIVTPKYVE